MITKITHLTLFVHDQNEALEFYKKLGFVIHTDAELDCMRWLTLNLPDDTNFELVLMKAQTDEQKKLVGKQAIEAALFCISTSDCIGDYEKFSAMGVKFLDTPQEQPWGISVTFQDLYGNMIYMVQPN